MDDRFVVGFVRRLRGDFSWSQNSMQDPLVHVRVQWTMETHTHTHTHTKKACAGLVAQLCRRWLFRGKVNRVSVERNPTGTNGLLKRIAPGLPGHVRFLLENLSWFNSLFACSIHCHTHCVHLTCLVCNWCTRIKCTQGITTKMRCLSFFFFLFYICVDVGLVVWVCFHGCGFVFMGVD